MPEVVVSNLTVAYLGVPALSNAELTFPDGQISVLLGPSGSGKSTLLMAVSGLVTPQGGRIEIGDRTVLDVKRGVNVTPEQRRLGVVFQSHALWPHMTVNENVGFPLRYGDRRVHNEERLIRVKKALALVGLDGYGDRYPNELSGGQAQRISLARALVYEPEVLLMDEPLSALDAVVRQQMRTEIAEIQRELGTTVIYVTHDRDDAERLADRLVVIRDGRVVEEGAAEGLFHAPRREFTARFLLDAAVVRGHVDGDLLRLDSPGVALSLVAGEPRAELAKHRGAIGFPPSAIVLQAAADGAGRVLSRTSSGGQYRYQLAVGIAEYEAFAHERFEPGATLQIAVRRDQLFAVSEDPTTEEVAN